MAHGPWRTWKRTCPGAGANPRPRSNEAGQWTRRDVEGFKLCKTFGGVVLGESSSIRVKELNRLTRAKCSTDFWGSLRQTLGLTASLATNTDVGANSSLNRLHPPMARAIGLSSMQHVRDSADSQQGHGLAVRHNGQCPPVTIGSKAAADCVGGPLLLWQMCGKGSAVQGPLFCSSYSLQAHIVFDR